MNPRFVLQFAAYGFRRALEYRVPFVAHHTDSQTASHPFDSRSVGNRFALECRHADFLAEPVHVVVQPDLAFVQQNHPAADPFHVRHMMRREEYCRTFAIQ